MEVEIIKGEKKTFSTGIQVGPNTKEVCGYEIIVDKKLSCMQQEEGICTLMRYHHTSGNAELEITSPLLPSLKLNTADLTFTYTPIPGVEEGEDDLCLSVTVAPQTTSGCPSNQNNPVTSSVNIQFSEFMRPI